MRAFLVRVRPGLLLVSEWLALAGGILLTAAAIFAVGAIGADAGGRPILGDTEVMEFAAAAAVASFLPWCQMRDGHVRITIFTDRLPAPILRTIDVAARFLFALVVTVLAWRLLVGGIDAFDRSRMTMFLQLPLWWGYLLASVPMALWVVVTWFGALEALFGPAEPNGGTPRPGFEEVGT